MDSVGYDSHMASRSSPSVQTTEGTTLMPASAQNRASQAFRYWLYSRRAGGNVSYTENSGEVTAPNC